jgi:hypothetical protein
VAIPKFEDFKAPWETDANGQPLAEEAQVVDKGVLKKWAWNLMNDKDKAQTGRDTHATKIGELTAQIETLKAAAPAGGGAADSSNPEIKRLMDLVTEMSKQASDAKLESTKVTVLTSKGLDPIADLGFFEKLGTAEEIEAMADKLVERGLAKKKTDGEGEEVVVGLDGKPVVPLNNGTPPGANDGELKVSVSDFLAGYKSGNPLF